MNIATLLDEVNEFDYILPQSAVYVWDEKNWDNYFIH